MIRLLLSLAALGSLVLNAPLIEAVECFYDKYTLRAAAVHYGDGSANARNDADKYGAMIGDWCFDESLTDLSDLFLFEESFNANISGWDVSRVTNMKYMFYHAEAFDGNISGWDVSSVENMDRMFDGALLFNSDISSWDVSKATSMKGMFFQAEVFNVDIAGWDVSKVANMGLMFYKAYAFNQNLCAWRDLLPVFNTDYDTQRMFGYTACPHHQTPGLAVPFFCRSCESPAPSASPSFVPSQRASTEPSLIPSSTSSASTSSAPSVAPSTRPSRSPSAVPSISPSLDPSPSPSVSPSSIPSEAPPQVLNFFMVNVEKLENGEHGRIVSSQKKVDHDDTHSLDFDWQSIQHNRVQVEIELEHLARSVLITTDDRPGSCVDASLAGTRVGVFNNGDLGIPYPIEVGVHKVLATAYKDKDCMVDPSPTSTLQLKVRYGSDTAENGCTQGYLMGFTYQDRTGQARVLQPGSRVCMDDPTIEAMTVACMEPDFHVRAVQQVRFRLNDRTAKARQPKFGYFKDETGPVYDVTFDLQPSSRYRLTADVKLAGLGKNSVFKRSFKTNGCDEL